MIIQSASTRHPLRHKSAGDFRFSIFLILSDSPTIMIFLSLEYPVTVSVGWITFYDSLMYNLRAWHGLQMRCGCGLDYHSTCSTCTLANRDYTKLAQMLLNSRNSPSLKHFFSSGFFSVHEFIGLLTCAVVQLQPEKSAGIACIFHLQFSPFKIYLPQARGFVPVCVISVGKRIHGRSWKIIQSASTRHLQGQRLQIQYLSDSFRFNPLFSCLTFLSLFPVPPFYPFPLCRLDNLCSRELFGGQKKMRPFIGSAEVSVSVSASVCTYLCVCVCVCVCVWLFACVCVWICCGWVCMCVFDQRVSQWQVKKQTVRTEIAKYDKWQLCSFQKEDLLRTTGCQHLTRSASTPQQSATWALEMEKK